VDFLSGVALHTRRRMQPLPAASTSTRAAPRPEPVEPRIAPEPEKPAAEPQPAPAQSAPLPSAASVAESVLMDHPGPKPVPPATTQGEPSPAIASPDLQPATGSPAAPETPQR